MENKIILSLLVFSLLIISACAQTTVEPITRSQEPVGVDVVSETSKTKTIEVNEEPEEIEEESVKETSPEVKELLSIADEKFQSLRYQYKGPQTKGSFYDFVVKGNKVKYILDPTFKDLNLDDGSYDAVYLDKELKTAQAYCSDRKCRVKGKKADLDYDKAYIWTPLDWHNNIEFAEKLGEELLGKRSTWRLSTSNLGTIWVDSFYGVPLQADFGGNLYQFKKMVLNDVKDEEVVPKG